MIREDLAPARSQIETEVVVIDPKAQYNIGASQKLSVHIPTFLQRNQDDPATKVRSFRFSYHLLLTISVVGFFSKS